MSPLTSTISDFRAHTRRHMERLRRTGRAEVLTSRGKVQGVVMSAEAYAALTGEGCGMTMKEAGWTRAFFDSIRIDDPAFKRVDQPAMPPSRTW